MCKHMVKSTGFRFITAFLLILERHTRDEKSDRKIPRFGENKTETTTTKNSKFQVSVFVVVVFDKSEKEQMCKFGRWKVVVCRVGCNVKSRDLRLSG